MRPDDLPAVTALLRELIGEVRGLRADLSTNHCAVIRSDPLLQALEAAVGRGIAFSASEITQTADERLAAVIGSDVRALGRRLARLEGRGLTRLGRDELGAIWALE